MRLSPVRAFCGFTVGSGSAGWASDGMDMRVLWRHRVTERGPARGKGLFLQRRLPVHEARTREGVVPELLLRMKAAQQRPHGDPAQHEHGSFAAR